MSARTSLMLTAGTAVLLALAVAPASATDWKYTSWTPPSSVNNVSGTIPLIESLEKRTNGTFKMQNFMGAQLFNARTTLKGVGDGVVDAGVIVPAFNPQELKHAVIITDAITQFQDGWASAPAATEALFTTCPECMADFKANNTISLGVYAGSPNQLQCAIEITKFEQLEGLKTAGVSSAIARWVEKIGETRQQIGPGDVLPALQRRQVDCTASPLEFLHTLSLKDVIKTIVDRPLGAFPAIHLMIVNLKSWNALSVDHKKALLAEMPAAIARTTAHYMNGDTEQRKKSKEEYGISIVHFDQLDKIWDEFAENERNKTVIDLAAARGISAETTKKILDAHLELYAKWQKIMDRVGRTEPALEKALWDEVFSKIDPDKI